MSGVMFLLACLFWSPCLADEPLACLSVDACYLGSWNSTSLGTVYASYQGVRYAQPPLDGLRFVPPRPFILEEGLWDVSGESDVSCSQIGRVGGSLQEDCLLLNIYSPKTESLGSPSPVMVWLHGGSLLHGSNKFSEQGPQHFLDRGVLVVTVNYRLGPLGFLSLGNEDVPGNAGMRDQALALAWVRDNIDRFGGNPSLVTLFGESAGSSSVAMLLLSPLSQGLFQRAILQSGTALGVSWGGALTTQNALHYGQLLAQGLGCDEEEDVLACLQGREVEEVLALTHLLGPSTSWQGTIWQAVPDSSFTTSPFLPGPPEELLLAGHFNNEVEIIIGTNADEGLIDVIPALLDPSLYEEAQATWDTVGTAQILGIADPTSVTAEDVEVSHQLLQFYVGGLDNLTQENLRGIVDMHTDSAFLYGSHRTIDILLSHGVRVYSYQLTYRGDLSITQLYGLRETVGVCHGDDLLYFWQPVLSVPGLSLAGEDFFVRELMTYLWTNFARYGDPSPPGSPVDWEAMKQGERHRFLDLSGTSPSMTSSEDIQQRMDVWDRLLGTADRHHLE